MRRTFPLALLLAVLVATQTGCVLYAHEIAQTRRALEAEYPEARFEKETMLNLGPVSLWMAGGLLRLTAREDYARLRPYLRVLRSVKIGIYRTEGLAAPGTVEPPALPFLRERGWRVAVRHTSARERTWVLYRPARRGTALRDLYVFTLDEEELVAVRLRGRLGQLARHVLVEEDVLGGLLGRDGEQRGASSQPRASQSRASKRR